MKVIKIILKVFVVILFIVSVLLNILLFNSSNGSLIFKYDETKFIAMNSSASDYLNSEYIGSQKDMGIQFKSNNIESCNEFIANYYIDNESNITLETVCSYTNDKGEQVTDKLYFENNIVYLDSNGVKTKQNATASSVIEGYKGLYSHLPLFLLSNETIKENDSKTTIGFSFSPLYVVGINYKYTDENNIESKYQYDLSGKLRKVTRKTDKKTETYEINYKSQKIEKPNLEQYGA